MLRSKSSPSSGHKAPASISCQGHLASRGSSWSTPWRCFLCQTFVLFASSLMDPVAALIAPLPASCGLFVSTFLTPLQARLLVRGCQKQRWRKWKYPHYANGGLHWWHVLFYKLHPPCQKSNCIWVTSEKLSQDFNLLRLRCHHQFSHSKYRHVPAQTWLCWCSVTIIYHYISITSLLHRAHWRKDKKLLLQLQLNQIFLIRWDKERS